MNGDWFYTITYGNFGDCGKDTIRSPSDKFTPWMITQSKCFARKGIERLSRSVEA